MGKEPSLVDLHSRVSTIEYAITEIKDAIKDIARATNTIAGSQTKLDSLAELAHQHEERIRLLEASDAESRGVRKLLVWFGPLPTLAALAALAWLAFHAFAKG